MKRRPHFEAALVAFVLAGCSSNDGDPAVRDGGNFGDAVVTRGRPDAGSTTAIVDAAAVRADVASGASHDGSDRQGDASAPSDAAPPTTVDPADRLRGRGWRVPCGAHVQGGQICENLPPGATACTQPTMAVDETITFGGRAGTTYEVSIRFRGVVEPKVYAGGQAGGDHFYVGGAPTATQYNVYKLEVSSPAGVYYLNGDEGGGEARYVFAIDYTKTIRIDGGATVRLQTSDSDCAMIPNCMDFAVQPCKRIVVPGVPPAPAGFDGQFVRMDVVAVSVAR